MRLICSDDWVPIDGVQLEDAAKDVVRCEGNVIVHAGPGAGKTELLAQKAAYLLMTGKCRSPRRILAICFKRDAARNLQERVDSRCRYNGGRRFSSKTYDAFAKLIFDQFRNCLPLSMQPSREYRLVGSQEAVNFLLSKGIRVRQRELEEGIRRTKLPFEKTDPPLRYWNLMMRGPKPGMSLLTYSMVLRLALFIVTTNPIVAECIRCTYSHIFLDEFQDTTGLQYNLVKACFGEYATGLTAVGDRKQRIMGWAGAIEGVFDLFAKEFSAQAFTLVMNHRSAPRLVELQRNMYEVLNENGPIPKVESRWGKDDGDIILYEVLNETVEAEALAKDIAQEIVEGVSPSDICILCRQHPENLMPSLSASFAKHQIKIRNEADLQDLIRLPAVDIVLRIFQMVIGHSNAREKERLVDELIELDGLSQEDKKSFTNSHKRISDLISVLRSKNLKNVTRDDLVDMYKEILKVFGANAIASCFADYSSEMAVKRDLKEMLDQVLKMLNKNAGDFTSAITEFTGDDSVALMTIHKSKGLQYSCVYIVGLEDQSFWGFKKQTEEERCAFFVALSRAKRKIVFTFSQWRNRQIQKHEDINEFFELLKRDGMAEVRTIGFEKSNEEDLV